MSSSTPIEPQDRLSLDDGGFSRLYRTTAQDLVVFFVRRTFDAEAAADLMAETFAKAYLGRRRFRGSTEEAARAWLFGIARRRLAMYVRRGKAERRALRRLGLERPQLVEGEYGRIEELAGLNAMRGTLAEHLSRLAPAVPGGLELRNAIAALHDGLMGVSRVEKAQVARGDTVLISAAGGSIGTWLIPLLAGTGATVVAAARGEGKLSLARERGADVTVDYSADDWPEHVRAATNMRDVDVVFDGAGGRAGARAFELTRRGARFFSYGSASGEFAGIEAAAERRGVEVIGIDEQLTPADQRRFAQEALARLAAGEIVPVIGQIVPLERAADAHAAIEERRVAGKTLLATGAKAT
jgi:NADPH:quinone reductase-like Zn-dependent oxidoreductase